MPGKPCATVVKALRVQIVLRLRLRGWELHDLVVWANQPRDPNNPADLRPWGVGESSIRKYLTEADRLIARALKEDREITVNRHIAQRRDLYRQCLAAGDRATALKVLADEAKLLGLYEPDRLLVQGEVGLRVVEKIVEVVRDEANPERDGGIAP